MSAMSYFRRSFAATLFAMALAPAAQAAVFTDMGLFTAANPPPGCVIHTQGFGSLPVEEKKTVNTLSTIIDSTTTVAGSGPGLVDDSVSYTSPGFPSLINWNGEDYLGIDTQSITAFNGNTINVNFSEPTSAAGVNVAAFEGFDYTLTVVAYDVNDAVLSSYTHPTSIMGDPTPLVSDDAGIQFVGFSGLGSPISRLELISSGNPSVTWSPVITSSLHCSSDVTAVPEPSSLLAATLCLGGVIARRRRK